MLADVWLSALEVQLCSLTFSLFANLVSEALVVLSLKPCKSVGDWAVGHVLRVPALTLIPQLLHLVAL